MRQDAGWLVNHDHIAVFVDNWQFYLWRLLFKQRLVDHDHVAFFDFLRRLDGLVVEANLLIIKQSFQRRAAKGWIMAGHENVCPFAYGTFPSFELSHILSGSQAYGFLNFQKSNFGGLANHGFVSLKLGDNRGFVDFSQAILEIR